MTLTPKYSDPTVIGYRLDLTREELAKLQWLLGIIERRAQTGADIDKSPGDCARVFLSAIGTLEASP